MSKNWLGLLPFASVAFFLALSCGSSDATNPGSAAGRGGNAGVGGTGGASAGGSDGGAVDRAGAAGELESGGAPSNGGGAGTETSAGADNAGAGGSAGADDAPLTPKAIPDLAFWLDGSAQSFSDFDENYPTPADSGRVRSVPEPLPLTGSWKAPTSLERPVRQVGAFDLRPVETSTGYYLKDTEGTIQTDNSTIALSFRNTNSNSAQGGLTAQIGMSSQNVGIYFVGNSIGIYYNHTQVTLKKRVSRGVHANLIVRFTPTGFDVHYDINGVRSTETVVAPIEHEFATNFLLGYDSKLNASIYGYVSQVVGVNRAISDSETSGLMDWLVAQPIPESFPVSKPLIAIAGDSIANGDQVPGWQNWAFTMLGKLSETNPDVRLLNDASNGAGVPTVKNSSYSDFILPWYSAERAKNILIVAAGTNDIANGGNLQDIIDRYWGLMDAARATGWKTVACTILPRSNASLIVGIDGFDTARKAFNAELLAHYAQHADALADVASVPGMGAKGDSDNTKYYSVDKIHPVAEGHALIEPVYRAAVKSLL